MHKSLIHDPYMIYRYLGVPQIFLQEHKTLYYYFATIHAFFFFFFFFASHSSNSNLYEISLQHILKSNYWLAEITHVYLLILVTLF